MTLKLRVLGAPPQLPLCLLGGRLPLPHARDQDFRKVRPFPPGYMPTQKLPASLPGFYVWREGWVGHDESM